MSDRPGATLPGHVTTPLLTRITEQSLDEDYRQVAERRRATGQARRPSGRPAWVAAAVITVFGVLVTIAAVQTSANSATQSAGREALVSRVVDERAALAAQQEEIGALQDTTIELAAEVDRLAQLEAEQNARLRRLQVVTGYVPVTGEGVQVVVDDAPSQTQLVRDEDLAKLVDGLWRAGAEAIAINNQRITVLTSIRNVGPAIRVNSRPVNPPYVVSAIGDRGSLQANLLDTTHGQRFFDLAENLGFLYSMQNVDELALPAARSPRLSHVKKGTAGDNPGVQEDEEVIP